MPQFLTTTGVSYHLEEIIKGAEERLVIISPYLRVNERVRSLFEDRDRLKVDIRVVYGKSELRPKEAEWLDSMVSIRTSFCKNLHAKCYLNEGRALVTSMNLYEFSQVNNYEMGVLVARDEEPRLYDEIYRESMRIVRDSDETRVAAARAGTEKDAEQSSKRKTRRKKRPSRQEPDSGFCIRCRQTLQADPLKAYCKRCYRSWNKYKNADYVEKHCHLCGSGHAATFNKPVCPKCYRKHRKVLTFPV
jgi:phosphatidylserine/phosphatidylglycerophosphate/cardiolipin synthase-like enzyme